MLGNVKSVLKLSFYNLKRDINKFDLLLDSE